MNKLFPSRPNILDIEASGFDAASYPIEVGVVLSNGDRYCSLIKPVNSWTHWDSAAEELHHISRDSLLRKGKSPATVCDELNQFLTGRVVYTDAWVWDKKWLTTLFEVANKAPSFELSPIESIQSECQNDCWDEAKLAVQEELGECRHRASEDAYLIQSTFEKTFLQCSLG